MNTNDPNTETISEITEPPVETKEALIDTNDMDIEPIPRQESIEDLPKEPPHSVPVCAALEEDILEKQLLKRNQELNGKSKPSRKHRKL